MTNKLCLVAQFDSKDYFQWHIALTKYASKLGIELTTISIAPVHKMIHNDFVNDPYWNILKEADYLFVYATRRSSRLDPTGSSWWTLPEFVKPFMKPTAKMLAQYDDEFMWLFDPEHVWWDIKKAPNPTNAGPEQFFKDTGILEIPDAHATVTNDSPFRKYTTKPVFKLLLPQLCRYNLRKYSENHKFKSIGMLIHSIRESSIHGTLENIVRPKNYAVNIFSGTLDREKVSAFRGAEKLPVNSFVWERVEYEPYMDLLWRNCDIGLDDNVGYYGWSRFVMECAIAYIPCIGSTEAVKDLFPELYTAPLDYEKQSELIERLRTDKKFYHEIAQVGHKRLEELFDEEKLCRALLDIFYKVGASKTDLTLKDAPMPPSHYNPDKHQAHSHP